MSSRRAIACRHGRRRRCRNRKPPARPSGAARPEARTEKPAEGLPLRSTPSGQKSRRINRPGTCGRLGQQCACRASGSCMEVAGMRRRRRQRGTSTAVSVLRPGRAFERVGSAAHRRPRDEPGPVEGLHGWPSEFELPAERPYQRRSIERGTGVFDDAVPKCAAHGRDRDISR